MLIIKALLIVFKGPIGYNLNFQRFPPPDHNLIWALSYWMSQYELALATEFS